MLLQAVADCTTKGLFVCTQSGTRDGTFNGVPPSGKKIAVQALNIYHLSPQGQFIQEYGQPDMLGLLTQIGAIPNR